ncbi:hypothetical protein [Corynebacterium phoceense]
MNTDEILDNKVEISDDNQRAGAEGEARPDSAEVEHLDAEVATPAAAAVGTEDSTVGEEEPAVGDEADSFPREYVEKLRKENGDFRTRAKAAEGRALELEKRLHAALVAADGRLADPEDLPFDAVHLEDADALKAAITELVERKPGLRARQYSGDVGAGSRAAAAKPSPDLIGLIRSMQ